MATVQKRGDSYRITASCGYDVKGKQIRSTITWTPETGMTKKQIAKELERQKVLFDERCKCGKISNGNIKFETFAEQWFQEYAEIKLRERTIARYKQLKDRTYTAIGHLRLNRITSRQIQMFINNLQEDGVNQKTKGKLAPKTIKHYLSFISSIFEYAIKMELVFDNPCKRVTLPNMVQKERDCYTLEEAQTFLNCLENEPLKYQAFFVLAIYGGFRRAELLGLEWKDINFKTGVISISRTSLYTKERGIYTDTTKTKSSLRSLKMPQCVLDILLRYKADQAEERMKIGDKWINSDRLFVTWNGSPMYPTTTFCWLKKFCQKYGLREVNVHSFRHLNATLLINNGVDPKTVSSALGHTQVSTTLNIYAHTFAEAQAKASETVADVLNFKRNKA